MPAESPGLTAAEAPPGGTVRSEEPVAPVRPGGTRRPPRAEVPHRDGRRDRRQRLLARRVRRVVRRLDPWSVLKVSLVFFLCCYVAGVVAGILLWQLADSTDVIANIESFVMDYGGFETFEFEPGLILQGGLLVGAVLVVLATGLAVLGAVLFNLISDLVGGVRVVVIEEDSARPAPVRGDSVSRPRGYSSVG